MGEIVVDDFEDGNMSEYTFSSNGDFQVNSNHVHHGSRSCESTSGTEPNNCWRTDTITSAGNTYHFFLRGGELVSSTSIGVGYGTTAGGSNLSTYFVTLASNHNTIRIGKYENGNRTILTEKNQSWSSNTWYEVIVDWQSDGTHDITVKDGSTTVVTGSMTDSTYSSGGLWLKSNPSGTTQPFNWDHFYKEGVPPPGSPSPASQTIQDNTTIDVSWSAASGTVDNYRLQVSEDGTAYFTVATPTGTSHSYTATGSVNTHRFRVRAENTTGNSSYTYTSTKSTDATSLSGTVVSEGEIDLSWTPADDESGYHVYRAEASGTTRGDYSQIADLAAGASSHSDGGVFSGSDYYYRVAAHFSGVDSHLTDEVSKTTPLPATTLDNIDATVEDELTLSGTVQDNSPEDGTVTFYRSTDGSLGSAVHTITDVALGTGPFGDYSWTDTGLPDGEQFYYTARRETPDASTDSQQLAAVTVLPPGDSPTLQNITADQMDVGRDDAADNEDGWRVHYKRSSASTYQQANGDLSPSASFYTLTGLSDGEEYDLRIETFTEDATAQSPASTATTLLPDLQTLTLADASVEDELTIGWGDVLDYGSYRTQYRVTGSGDPWIDDGTVGQDTAQMTITGLSDGEEYDLRVRTESEHVNGAWLAITGVTLLPAPGTPTIDSQTSTSVTVAFADNADNADGNRLQRRRQYESGWGSWSTVVDGAPSTTPLTDSTAQPAVTYEYRVETYTEHSTAMSPGTVEATTPGLGVEAPRVPSTGWYVEVDHPGGQVLRPRLLDDPQARPRLNGLPEVEIPVPRSESWHAEAFERADMRVWRDGARLPIEELVDVQLQADRSVLVGRGGVDLEGDLAANYSRVEAHTAAETIIQDETGYAAHVDDPATGESRIDVQAADTDAEWQAAFPGGAVPATTPASISGGSLSALQTLWFWEGEAFNARGSVSETSIASQNAAESWYFLNTLPSDSKQFAVSHDIPAGHLTARVRWRAPTGNHPGFKFHVDGESQTSLTAGTGGIETTYDWLSFASFENGLSAGTHTFEIEMFEQAPNNDPVYIDAIAVYDDRFGYTFDNQPHGAGQGQTVIDGPELYPDAVDLEFEGITTVRQVVGAALTTTGDAPVELALSNDDGATWQTVTDAQSLDVDFASGSASIKARVTLGRTGTKTTTSPTQGIAGQSIDSLLVQADVTDTPLLVNQRFTGSINSVLQDIATQGRFVWEIQWDSSSSGSSGGGIAVEWTRPGQRTGDVAPGLVDYRSSKSTKNRIQKAILEGAAQPITGETFIADHGTAVSLGQSPIVPGSEAVRDSSGTRYTADDDYDLDTGAGTITTLATGDMADGSNYSIDYSFKTVGSYALPNAGSSPRTLRETFPALTTSRLCDELAFRLVSRYSEPFVTARVTLDKQPLGFSLVDALSVETLPTDGQRLSVWEIQDSPQQTTLQMGARDRIQDAVTDIRQQLGAVSGRV